MAASKASNKHRAVTILDVAFSLVAEQPPSCEALYAAAEAIQQLITEHCPIAQPMRQVKKKPVKK
jgi:hypothetical protein